MKKIGNQTKLHGFTLLELMIAIAIIGILAAIAYPSFASQLQKSRRTSAKTALLDLASREAKYYSLNNAYTTSMIALGYASAGPIAVPDNNSYYYDLSIATENITGYIATAAPNVAGSQAADGCGSYTIDYLGVKGAGAGNCW